MPEVNTDGLHLALLAKMDTKKVVQLLLDHSVRNIDYNAKCFNGLTGFIFACHCGHNDVVHLLLTQVLIMMDSLG